MAEEAPDELEVWLERMCARMRSDGLAVEAAFDDRMLGSLIAVLVTIDGDFCEIDLVRTRRKHAHVAVFGESEVAARKLATALDDAHRAISRFANAERKLVHRIERVAAQLAHGWSSRIGGYPGGGLARLQTTHPSAKAMLGVGYHLEIAGAGDDDKSKHRYDPFCGASIEVPPRRRALVWDPRTQWFAAPTATPTVAPLVAASGDGSGVTGDVIGDVAIEATTEACWAIPQLSGSDCVPDLSSCVPDCGSFDVPDCDCGGVDLL